MLKQILFIGSLAAGAVYLVKNKYFENSKTTEDDLDKISFKQKEFQNYSKELKNLVQESVDISKEFYSFIDQEEEFLELYKEVVTNNYNASKDLIRMSNSFNEDPESDLDEKLSFLISIHIGIQGDIDRMKEIISTYKEKEE